jgi:hypothetical protein
MFRNFRKTRPFAIGVSLLAEWRQSAVEKSAFF